MLILVTRPEPQATEWADRLHALGEQASALPLIDIAPPVCTLAVEQSWRTLDSIRMVMFVSPNAALWFARARPKDARWPAHVLAAAPGPGTATTVLHELAPAGLTPEQIVSPPVDSLQFDSEHLWPLLAPLSWAGQGVLIVGGGDQDQPRGRAWLGDRLREAGANVEALLAYRRGPAHWTPAQCQLAALAYAQPASHLWLLSSSEAVDHLLTLQGPVPPGSRALATHPRVADKARSAGFGEVLQATPSPEAVAQARRGAP